MIEILFEPSGKRISVPYDTSLLQAARLAGVQIDAACGGGGKCGKCKVRVHDQDFLSPLSFDEREILTDDEVKQGLRLACACLCRGDVTVELLSEGVQAKSVILTALDGREKAEKIDARSGFGAAIDIGTTTIAAYLLNLTTGEKLAEASMLNPQIPYGDDVISRITFCVKNEKGTFILTNLVREALNQLLGELARKACIQLTEIVDLILVCNPVMEHILLGVSPESLGHAPFSPLVKDMECRRAEDLNLSLLPSARVTILPAADGFVGADHIAVLLHLKPWEMAGNILVIDIGTNSEICFSRNGRLFVTSCATGPALEGAEIQCGMRAAEGAIDHVKIDPVTLEPHLHVIGHVEPVGICGSGIVDVVAQFFAAGVIGAEGAFSKRAQSDRIRENAKHEMEFVLWKAEEREIVVTERDIRAIQLAKAALYAGVKMLLMESGTKHEIDRIYLAGAFGCYLNQESALLIGLFPEVKEESIISVGNAAGDGAIQALLSMRERKLAEEIREKICFVDTVSKAGFQTCFAEAMVFPHRRDACLINKTAVASCPGHDGIDRSKGPYLTLPAVQNVEACAYGAPVSVMKGYLAPGAYPYGSIDQAAEAVYQRNLLEMPEIQAVFAELDENGDTDQNIILEAEAPFTVLSALVDPRRLFAALRKEPEKVEKILLYIAEGELKYLEQAVKKGVRVISLADPVGASSMIGDDLYRKVVGASQVFLLKKCRRFLKKGLIHVCSKMSADLVRAGLARSYAVRVERGKAFSEALFSLADDEKIRYTGLNCIHKLSMGIPIVNVIEMI